MAKPWSPRSAELDGSSRDLDVRPGSPVKRDVYKAATAGLTGLAAFGTLAVTGSVAGTAAHQKALEDSARPASPALAPQVVEKRRKHRTVVRTRIVHEASSSGVARPTTGGTVSGGGTVSHTTSHSSGTTPVTHSAPRPAAPAPAPAPSSGS